MIEEIVAEYGLKDDDRPILTKTQEDATKDFGSIPSSLIGCSLEEYIRKRLINEAKRIKKANAETIFGTIVTFTPPKSSTSRKISEAIIAYKENSEKALEDGYVAEYRQINDTQFQVKKLTKQGVVGTKIESKVPEGAIGKDGIFVVPLDNQKKFRNGKDSFKYLTVLPTESYFCNISGIMIKDEAPAKFKMSVNTNDSSFTVPMNKTIKFRAEVGERDKENYYQLKFKKDDTKFEIIPGVSIDPLKNAIYEMRKVVDIVNIPEIHNNAKEGSYGVPIAIAGTVTELWISEPTDDKPNAMSTLYIEDTSTEVPIKIQCHKAIPINFAIGSFVYVLGSTSKGKKWDKETRQPGQEDDYTIWADGIVAVVNTAPEEPPEPINPENLKTESGESWY